VIVGAVFAAFGISVLWLWRLAPWRFEQPAPVEALSWL
jgi:hypothetical protein